MSCSLRFHTDRGNKTRQLLRYKTGKTAKMSDSQRDLLSLPHTAALCEVQAGTFRDLCLTFRDYTTSFFFFFKLYTKHVSLCRGKRAICPSAARVMFQTSFLFISCSVEVFLLLFLSASLHVKL